MKIHVQHQDDEKLIECQQVDEISGLRDKIGKLDKAVFFGNGKPAIVTQLATIQQTIQALTWLAAVTLTAVIGQVVFLAFKTIAK